MPRPCLLLTAILILPGLGPAQAPAPTPEPPVAHRVEPFSGAVGSKFTVTTQLEPAAVQVGEPLRFTVRVQAEGPWQRPPQRPDLRRHEKYARFARQFHIENAAERQDARKGSWEFDYRLRPLNDAVTEVPRLPWVYYKPGSGYQTTYAPAVKFTVHPRAVVSPTQVQGEVEVPPVPDRLTQFQDGIEVLRQESDSALPSPGVTLLVLLGIPVLCVGWYAAWRRLYPEAARLAQLRKSQAARAALQALRRVARTTPETQVEQCTLILTDYLRQRLDLSPAEPTPAEIAAHLQLRGAGAERTERLVEFFHDADAVRFAAGQPGDPAGWRKRVADLILALEALPCPPPASC